MTGRVRRIAPLSLVVLYATLPAFAFLQARLTEQDEALLLVYPEHILAGAVPNRDFFTVYGPGGFWLLAAVFKVAGPTVLAERVVGLGYHVALSTGVYRLIQPWGNRRLACAAGSACALILLPLGLGAYAWLGAVALVVWSIGLLTVSECALPACAGLLGGLAVAWRLEIVVPLVAASVPLLWRTPAAKRWAIGAAIGLMPLAAHSVVAGSALYRDIFVDRLLATNTGLPFSAHRLGAATGVAVCVGAVTALCIVGVRDRSRRSLALAVLSVAVLPQAFQRIDQEHVRYVACLVVPLAGAALVARLPKSSWPPLAYRRGPAIGLATALGVLLALTGLSIAFAAENPARWVDHEGRAIPVSTDWERQDLQELLMVVTRDVPAGSRIFVGAEDMSVATLSDVRLYHLLPEFQARSYYLELPPGVAEVRGSGLAQDIAGADALLLDDVPKSRGRALFPLVPPGDDAANIEVRRHFCAVDRVGTTTLYRRCR